MNRKDTEKIKNKVGARACTRANVHPSLLWSNFFGSNIASSFVFWLMVVAVMLAPPNGGGWLYMFQFGMNLIDVDWD